MSPLSELRVLQARVVDRIPMSPWQAACLTRLERSADEPGLDVQQVSITVQHALDPALYVYAWYTVMERHPALRSRFRWDRHHQPVQEVLDAVELPVARADWRALDDHALRAHLQALAHRERMAGFDPMEAPLMRLHLARIGDLSWNILWTFHHLLLDGRAIDTLLKESFEVHDGLRHRREVALAPAPFYRPEPGPDPDLDEHAARAHWARTLAGANCPTPLGIDLPPAAAAQAPADCLWGARQTALPEADTQRLRQRADEAGVGLSTLLLAAWGLLLSRYGGSHDVVFGVTHSLRHRLPQPQREACAHLINTLPMRVRLDPGQPVDEWLPAIRQQQLAVRPHDHLPTAEIESLVSLPDDAALFDTVVVYEHRSLTQRMRSLGGVWESRHVDHVGQTGAALTLVAHGDPQLLLRLEYDRRRFSDGVMERMLGHLSCVLEGLASDRYERVGQLPWVTEAERLELIGEPADALPPAQPLHRRFELQVQRAPHAPALTVRDAFGRRAEWSYLQLDTLSNALAARLRQGGVTPGQVVGLRCQPTADLAVAMLAILKAGGAILPLDPSQPRERAAFMMEDARARVLVCSQTASAEWSDADVLTVVIVDADADAAASSEGSLVKPDAVDASPREALAADLAFVIYTSGESGVPKGVAITHATVGQLLDRTQPLYGFDERDVWGFGHPYSLPVAWWDIWGAWSCGGRLLCVLPERGLTAEAWRRWLCEERVTVLHQTPSEFYRLMKMACADDPWPLSLRYLFLGGEALDIRQLGPWFDRYGDARPQLVNVFGSLESCLHVTARPLQRTDVDEAFGSVIGEPQAGQRVYLVNESGELVPRGVPGELAVAVPDPVTDYLRRPALGAKRFVPDPFSGIPGGRLCLTGDWARWLDNGDLEYLGRRDRQVKLNGYRAEPAEIEALLSRHPHVRQAAVVAVPLSAGAWQLNAYVVPALLGRGVPEGAPEPELASQLRGYLQRWLPAALVPTHFVCLDELPLTDEGLPDVGLLPSPHERRIERVPQSATEITGWPEGPDRPSGGALKVPAVSDAVRALGHAVPAPDMPLVAPSPRPPWFMTDTRTGNDLCSVAWSMDVLLPVSAAQIQSAFAWLSEQHPMLRQRFVAPEAGDPPWPAPDLQPAAVVVVHVAHLDDEGIARLMQERVAEARAGLSLAQGPVARCVFVDKGPLRLASLVLVAHRRVADEWSWTVLRDDLERALMALRQGDSLAQLASSAEIQPLQRTRDLQAAAASPGVHAELSRWLARSRQAVWRAPPPPQSAGHASAVVETASRWLAPALVQAWCGAAPAADSAQASSIWLGALANALHQLTGLTAWRVDLLGHGRSPVSGAPDRPGQMVRTVGGWSHPYPWTLNTRGAASVAAMAQAVAADMAELAQSGLGYALLRWMHPDDSLRQMLAEAPAAPLLFVSLPTRGLAQADHTPALLRPQTDADRWVTQPLASSGYPVALSCAMTAQGLRLQAVWDASQVDKGWVEHLLAYWLGGLQAGPTGQSVAPAEDPARTALTPAQETLWAQCRNAPGMGFHQWQFDVHGPLQVDRLREACEWLVSRHAPLSWSVSEDAHGPAVMQRLDASGLSLPWRQDDWRRWPPDAQRTALRQGLEADRAEPQPTDQPPLMRLWLVRLQDERWRLVWRVHALILDRWSRAPLVAELSRVYTARCLQRTPEEAPAEHRPAVGDGWLRQWERQHAADARNHWTRQWQAAEAARLPTHQHRDAMGAGEMMHSAYRHLAADVALALAVRAHQWRLAPSTLMLAAWAAVDAHRSNTMDTMVGCELTGRPGTGGAASTLIGPWAQQVPVMVTVQPAQTLLQWLGQLHTQLAQAEQFQFLGLEAIRGLSGRFEDARPFDALLVFEGLAEDTGAQRLGDHAQLELVDQFSATGHPLTVVVRVDNLGWHLQAHAQAQALGWDGSTLVNRLHEVVFLLERLATAAGHESVGDWMQQLPVQPVGSAAAGLRLAPR